MPRGKALMPPYRRSCIFRAPRRSGKQSRSTGADGYAATPACADFSPELAARPAVVAYAEDGKPLGQPRVVVPADLSGARYVRDLIDLCVVNLAVGVNCSADEDRRRF